MSMDIVVWAACAVSIPAGLPEAESWKNYGGPDWAYESSTWQVIAEPLEGQEASEGVRALDDKAGNAIVLVLEPIGADKSGYQFLNDVAVAIAKTCGGAVLDGPMGPVKLDESGEEVR